MKIKRPLNITQKEFFEKLDHFVRTDKTFNSHPHNLKKPFFGKTDENTFLIKNSPSLFYRDSTILISGKIQKDKLEVSTKPYNLILIIVLSLLLIGLTIIFFALEENELGKIGIIFIILFWIYLIVPYLINNNRFKKILTEINRKNI